PREPVPLRALVEDCWRSHAPRAAARGLRFEDRIAPDRTVATHPDTLRLIVDNLLANAAEYTEPGGEVVVDGGAGATIVDVTDSGPSLSADELARVFDRMWRAEAARSGGAHAGIGLALVKVACAALGHDVSARTLDDGRVSFRVTARDDAASLDGRDA
ncbi:MAG: HAMP domain-containing histidine kinase, partial [Myxococcales bacterium]|nr:HAMP domain-containing histidine kinase [Myxococcales bacterium]